MARVTRSVIITAEPEEIWSFVGDPVRELAWRQPGLEDLELVDGEPIDVGSRYRGRTKRMGRENTYLNRITEFDPPHRVAWDWLEASGPLAASGSYDLQPLGGGRTRFKLALNYQANNMLGRLLLPLVDLLAGPMLQRFALALKQAVESGRSRPDS